MSEDDKKQEEREFQLRMLEGQISIGNWVTLFSLFVAVAYSVSLSLYSIALTNVPELIRTILLTTSLIALFSAIASNILLMVFQRHSMPEILQKIRDDFVKPLAHETTKKSVMVTLDKDLLKWLEDETKKKEFGSISHGIEKALVKLKEEYEKRP
jgi:hypothetical protein